jgi:hypothetical protein
VALNRRQVMAVDFSVSPLYILVLPRIHPSTAQSAGCTIGPVRIFARVNKIEAETKAEAEACYTSLLTITPF